MKRTLQILCGTLAILLLALGVTAWQLAFHTPTPARRPLPSALTALDSQTGQRLLADSLQTADYQSLTDHFVSQMRPAYCGVASMVIVYNALRNFAPQLTQSSFFSDHTRGTRTALQVTFSGMTLAQLGLLLEAKGLHARVYYTDDTDAAAFRALAKKNLESSGDYLLVNYQRAALGQEDMGHISPLAAYNAEEDKLLVLDVAAHKYPPTWVSAEMLWSAMNTIDLASGKTRGFVVVRDLVD